jgi:hypothetical protein
MATEEPNESVHPGDYPLGSREGRAAARAVLENPGGRLAYLIVEFVGLVRDSSGELVGPNLDFRRAEIGDRVFERGEGEGLEAFKARVIGELPATQAIGSPMVSFLSDDVCV